MKKTLWIVVLLCALGGMAQTLTAASLPRITMAVMCRSYPNKKPTGITNTFKPTDQEIHCVYHLASIVKGTTGAKWYAVRVQGVTPNTKIFEAQTKPMRLNIGHFTITNTRPWPRGQYRVDIYLNTTRVRSMPFTIK